jgi:ATP-dependent Clp protease ATP-binding subunit ClpC
MNGYNVTTCPTCHGFGMLQDKNSRVTCTACAGRGIWWGQEGQPILYYPVPELLSAHPSLWQTRRRPILLASTALAWVVTATALAGTLAAGPSTLSELFWQQGINRMLFGVSGLAGMTLLAAFHHQQTSQRSLHDLPAQLSRQQDSRTEGQGELHFSLAPYANPRVAALFQDAATLARAYHTPSVSDPLFLLTLLRTPHIQGMINRLELSSEELIRQLEATIPDTGQGNIDTVFFDPKVRERIYAGFSQALEKDFPYVDTEDLLLAYTRDSDAVGELLHASGLTYEDTYAMSRWYAEEQEQARRWAVWLEKGRTRPKGYMNRAWTALPTPFLDQYSLDITQLAAQGKVAVAEIRQKEMDSILQILGQTQHNSVLLVGEPGVGKQTLVNAIALRMIEEQVPEILKDKRLVSMDLGALLSNSGEAEANMQRVLEEVAHAGNVILAIPEVQALVGTSGHALDAATLLANALNRGYIQVISTATHADYHRYVESNPNLSSLLQVVQIEPATPEQAITVLEEEAPQIEHRQKVLLTYPAIETAVELATRFLPNQALPESALLTLDEAAAMTLAAKQRWVTKQQVQKVMEQKTGVPIQEAGQQEADLLLNLEEHLHQRIIGQEAAVTAVAAALRRSRAGLRDEKRPISSFLFVGPTGVGKTEMAKTVADLFFRAEDRMIRLDMSEYQDNKAVYRLIGAPASDAESYTEGGMLTQPVRDQPYSLLLFDEIEKADPDVLNLFLQLLDDGRLTENTGRTVHFNNTIIIATSNAGSPEVLQLIQQNLQGEQLDQQVLRILQQHFRPEFLNRFDAIIPFRPLNQQEVEKIASLMLVEVGNRAKEQGITLQFLPETVTYLAQQGFDPQYGARPLRRVIQEKVEGALARLILARQVEPGSVVTMTPEMVQ